MKRITILALAFCLVGAFAASVWSADIPGQKLTQDEMASITGKANPVTIPMSFFQNLSPSGTTVIINAQKVQPSSPVYKLGGVTVVAGATFIK
jgi:hypothetical protein